MHMTVKMTILQAKEALARFAPALACVAFDEPQKEEDDAFANF
jgi:hypothetical protein